LEWADQLELSPRSGNAKSAGRPIGALLEAAKHIGIERQRVFEARQIRETNAGLYKELKAGRRSLNSALDEIKPQKETNLGQLDSLKSERSARQDADGGTQTPAVKERATATNSKLPPSPPSTVAIERALIASSFTIWPENGFST
jgi:hypothetical protein